MFTGMTIDREYAAGLIENMWLELQNGDRIMVPLAHEEAVASLARGGSHCEITRYKDEKVERGVWKGTVAAVDVVYVMRPTSPQSG